MDVVQQELDRLNFRPHATGFRAHTEKEILRYESLLARRLPEDFRWFAKTYGSGWLGGGETSITLTNGHDVQYETIGSDLRHRDVYVEPHYPSGLVDCASDVMGDVFFLRLSDTDDNGVWFWGYYEGKDPHTGLVRAADSFSDLLARTVVD